MLRLELDYEGGVVNFPIDHARSFIEGIIVAHEPDAVRWNIQIECHEALIPPRPEDKDEDDPHSAGYPEDCNLELSGLSFPLAGWRELAGKTSEVTFAADEVHPILPDNPGNFYFDSCHHVPNNNRVRFGDRDGARFAVEWQCVAHAYADDEGKRIEVKTYLPLRQFQVYFGVPGSVSLEAARQLVLRFARVGDIGEPVQRTPQWVVVPVRPEAA
jgi:hypothetical protein